MGCWCCRWELSLVCHGAGPNKYCFNFKMFTFTYVGADVAAQQGNPFPASKGGRDSGDVPAIQVCLEWKVQVLVSPFTVFSGMSWIRYEQELDRNLYALHEWLPA